MIIPAYNAEPYIEHLINRLKPQITDEVEVIVVDDGSDFPYLPPYEWVKVITQKNKGVSAARNTGLNNAKGQYVAFIDADDLVAENYIETILDKIKTEKFDYCYMSWKTFGKGWKYEVILKDITDKFPPFNLCVWNRIYKRSLIGKTRFNENKIIAEDAEFIRDIVENGKKAFISQPMYFYRVGHGGNLTERFNAGELDFQRIVYNIPKVTLQMADLISEVAEANKTGEVIIMTDKCELPLDRYAMVIKPQKIAGTELRGQPTDLFRKIARPLKAQIIIYVGNTQEIGGIETFLYNFCKAMHEQYDILVFFSESMPRNQLERLLQYVEVSKLPNRQIVCDVLLNIRITDKLPENIKAKKVIQMVHTCQMADHGKYHYKIVPGWNELVAVSNVAGKSFGEDAKGYKVIPNFTDDSKPKKSLLLVSATRLTYEKGEERIEKLAAKLQAENVPFIWLLFSATPLKKPIPGVVHCSTTLDIRSYMKKADYVVQLSDKEAFCYTLREALELGVPVITTPIDVLDEIGFVDGVYGYTVPFDMADVRVQKIYNSVPKFKALENKNEIIMDKWRQIIGNLKPIHSYKPSKTMRIVVTEGYFDTLLNRQIMPGEILEVETDRGFVIISKGYAEKC